MHALDVLGDPVRRRILELLGDHQADGTASLSAGDIATTIRNEFSISQPAVSQHLAHLKGAGLVNDRREGRCVYYRVEPRGMKPLVDWIAHYRAFWTEHVDRLERLLEKMDQ